MVDWVSQEKIFAPGVNKVKSFSSSRRYFSANNYDINQTFVHG